MKKTCEPAAEEEEEEEIRDWGGRGDEVQLKDALGVRVEEQRGRCR